MENASKALLIAGGILIVLLLLSFAILTLSSTSGLSDQRKNIHMTQEAISSNSRFSSYFGKKISGTDVISFLQLVIVNNSQTSNPIFIEFKQSSISSRDHKSTSEELQTIIDNIVRSSYYNINLTSDCSDYPGGYRNTGHYGCITITKL